MISICPDVLKDRDSGAFLTKDTLFSSFILTFVFFGKMLTVMSNKLVNLIH